MNSSGIIGKREEERRYLAIRTARIEEQVAQLRIRGVDHGYAADGLLPMNRGIRNR